MRHGSKRLTVSVLGALGTMILGEFGRAQYILKSESDLVLVPINVVDQRSSLPVGGLKKADFQLSVDGVQTTIAFFQEGTSLDLPRALAIIFDGRGVRHSQRGKVGETFRDVSWSAWLGQLSSQDSIAVLRTGKQAEILQDYTTDRGLISEALAAMASVPKLPNPGERLPQGAYVFDLQLDEAIHKADEGARKLHGPILKQVVVITSDLDVVEKAEYDRVVRSLQQEGITLNVVLVQKGARMGRAILRELAAINGRAYQ